MSLVSKLINAVVLLILLTALSDPEQYHLTSAELANDLDVMDDASKYPEGWCFPANVPYVVQQFSGDGIAEKLPTEI